MTSRGVPIADDLCVDAYLQTPVRRHAYAPFGARHQESVTAVLRSQFGVRVLFVRERGYRQLRALRFFELLPV
jgi:hypothetical protein